MPANACAAPATWSTPKKPQDHAALAMHSSGLPEANLASTRHPSIRGVQPSLAATVQHLAVNAATPEVPRRNSAAYRLGR